MPSGNELFTHILIIIEYFRILGMILWSNLKGWCEYGRRRQWHPTPSTPLLPGKSMCKKIWLSLESFRLLLLAMWLLFAIMRRRRKHPDLGLEKLYNISVYSSLSVKLLLQCGWSLIRRLSWCGGGKWWL